MARVFYLTSGVLDCPKCLGVGVAYLGELRDAIGVQPAVMCIYGCGSPEQCIYGGVTTVSNVIALPPALPPTAVQKITIGPAQPMEFNFDPRATPPMHFSRCKCDIKDLLTYGHKEGCSKL